MRKHYSSKERIQNLGGYLRIKNKPTGKPSD